MQVALHLLFVNLIISSWPKNIFALRTQILTVYLFCYFILLQSINKSNFSVENIVSIDLVLTVIILEISTSPLLIK